MKSGVCCLEQTNHEGNFSNSLLIFFISSDVCNNLRLEKKLTIALLSSPVAFLVPCRRIHRALWWPWTRLFSWGRSSTLRICFSCLPCCQFQTRLPMERDRLCLPFFHLPSSLSSPSASGAFQARTCSNIQDVRQYPKRNVKNIPGNLLTQALLVLRSILELSCFLSLCFSAVFKIN